MTMTNLTKTMTNLTKACQEACSDIAKGHAMTMTNLAKTCRKARNDNDKSDQGVPKGIQ